MFLLDKNMYWNIKRLLLITKNRQTQDNDFSALLCVGKYKNLGSLKLFSLDMHLNYLGFPSGASGKEPAC